MKSKPINPERVLLLCDFFSSYGGTELYNYTLANELQKRGIEVRVYIGEKPRLSHWLGLAKNDSIFTKYPDIFHVNLEQNEIEKKFVDSIVDEVNLWNPDIIHTHPFKKMAIQWLKHPRHNPNIPLVATEWTVPNNKNPHWFERDMYNEIHHVSAYIATCETVHKAINSVHSYTGPVADIPHLVESKNDSISTPSNLFQNVAYIGRFSKEKGVNYLIQSWIDVLQAHPNATLTLYGHGDEESNLKQLASKLGVTNSVHFAGTFSPYGGIEKISKNHQLFIQPSIFESIPTSLIELMLRGKTIIATDVGGVKELVDETTGILIPSENADAISTAICYFLSNPEEAISRGNTAHRSTKQIYILDKNIDKIIELYRSLIK
jgi:glycosyltransferase involved in cell wall biosynthesis